MSSMESMTAFLLFEPVCGQSAPHPVIRFGEQGRFARCKRISAIAGIIEAGIGDRRLAFASSGYSAVGHSGHRRSRMGHSDLDPAVHERRPWNAGQEVGPKRPLRPRDIWAIRFFLDEHKRIRDRALFDLAIDSKLRGCDLVKMRIGDLVSGGSLRNRATVIQQKTSKPVQFEIMTEARNSLTAWLARRGGTLRDFVFPSRVDYLGHLSTRQYARLLDEWVSTIGLDHREYGTHTKLR